MYLMEQIGKAKHQEMLREAERRRLLNQLGRVQKDRQEANEFKQAMYELSKLLRELGVRLLEQQRRIL